MSFVVERAIVILLLLKVLKLIILLITDHDKYSDGLDVLGQAGRGVPIPRDERSFVVERNIQILIC